MENTDPNPKRTRRSLLFGLAGTAGVAGFGAGILVGTTVKPPKSTPSEIAIGPRPPEANEGDLWAQEPAMSNFYNYPTWGKAKFFDIGFNASNGYGGDVDVEHISGTYYTVLRDPDTEIVMISSTDPAATTWTDEGTLATASDTVYSYVTDPAIIEVNGTWYLYFSAGNTTSDQETTEIYVGTASSPTGSYTIQSTGLAAGGGGWRDYAIGEPAVCYDEQNQQWVMAVTGAQDSNTSEQSSGLAISSDGTTWSWLASNPIITSGPNSDSTPNIVDPEITCENGMFTHYANEGTTKYIQKWISTDLDNWSLADHTPVIKGDRPEDTGGGPFAPAVIDVDGTSHMWYSAQGEDGNYRVYVRGKRHHVGGEVRRYNGSSWVTNPVFSYDGSRWRRTSAVNRYNGSEWNRAPPLQQPTIIDRFEDLSLSEYNTYDRDGDGTVTASDTYYYGGSGALELSAPSASNTDMSALSNSGLDNYPSRGQSFKYNLYFDNNSGLNATDFVFFAGSGSGTPRPDDCYFVETVVNGEIRLYERSTGSNTLLDSAEVTWSNYEKQFLEVVVNPQSDGTISVTLRDILENQIAQISPSDSTHDSGGVGAVVFANNNDVTEVFYDEWEFV